MVSLWPPARRRSPAAAAACRWRRPSPLRWLRPGLLPASCPWRWSAADGPGRRPAHGYGVRAEPRDAQRGRHLLLEQGREGHAHPLRRVAAAPHRSSPVSVRVGGRRLEYGGADRGCPISGFLTRPYTGLDARGLCDDGTGDLNACRRRTRRDACRPRHPAERPVRGAGRRVFRQRPYSVWQRGEQR